MTGRGKRWAEVKTQLEPFDRKGLVRLIADLYEASPANRRFLESRLLPASGAIEEYRRMVADAIYPDVFSRRPISIRDASAAITEYRRSTGDVAGTIDLMLTFVETGTAQSVDLGYGDDGYFNALASKVNAIVKALEELSTSGRETAIARLTQVRNRAQVIGWGYGDFLNDVVRTLEDQAEPRTRPKVRPDPASPPK